MRNLNIAICVISMAFGGFFASCDDDLPVVKPESNQWNLSQRDKPEQLDPTNAGVVDLSVSASDLYRVTVSISGDFPTQTLKGDNESHARLSLPSGEYYYTVSARGCLCPNDAEEKELVCTPSSGLLVIKEGKVTNVDLTVRHQSPEH